MLWLLNPPLLPSECPRRNYQQRNGLKVPNPKVVQVPIQVTGWWYQEFSAGQKATPSAGIDAAQTWLNDNIKPNTPVVFGNVDGQGTVRLFWYGSKSLTIGPALP
jgi:hypothetical protein